MRHEPRVKCGLPAEPHRRALLPELPETYRAARRAIAANSSFIEAMLSVYMSPAAPPHLRIEPLAGPLPRCSPGDAEKVRYVFKNLSRDWAAEGAEERAQCYAPLLEELRRALPQLRQPPPGEEVEPRVLVPGAGLGRLCVEVRPLIPTAVPQILRLEFCRLKAQRISHIARRPANHAGSAVTSLILCVRKARRLRRWPPAAQASAA